MDRKLSIDEFNNYKARLEKIISAFSEQMNNLSREEKLKLQNKCIDEYVKLEEELFSYDLRDIPFELFENMTLMARDGEVLDLSKSQANIDFNYVRVFNAINFKGCQIKNLIKSGQLVNPKYLDMALVEANKEYFLSDSFPDDFKDKWYRDNISLADISKLPDELVEKLPKYKEFLSLLHKDANCIKALGLKMVVNLYRYSPSDYEDVRKLVNLLKGSNVIRKFDATITSPEDLIKNVYQIMREELLHPSNMYTPIYLSLSHEDNNNFPAKFPEKFVQANEDIFKTKEEMSEDLRTRYFERKLTSDDILKNYDLFKNLPLNSFCAQNTVIKKLNDLFGDYAFQKIYETYPEAIKYVAFNGFNVNLNLIKTKDPIAGFKEAVAMYLQIHGLTNESEVPKWAKPMFLRIVSKYETIDDLKTYDDKTCLLDYSERNLINKVGIANILRFDEETKILSYKDNSFEFLEAWSSYIKDWYKGSISPDVSYPEFRGFMASCLNAMRKQNYFTDYQDYRFIEGTFRNDFRDIFISEEAPEELIDAFYRNKITPRFIRLHKNYLSYLEDENLENVINFNYNVRSLNDESFIKYYTESFGKVALLELLATYGELIDKNIANAFLTTKMDKISVDKQLMNIVYYVILTGKGYDSYQFLEKAESFVNQYPELFLLPDELKDLQLYSKSQESIVRGFYEGKLSYNDIFLNPQIVSVLKHKNLYVAFRKNSYNYSGKAEAQIYLEKLGTNNFLKLCTTYGKFLTSTIGLLREENIISYESLCLTLEQIIVKRVKQEGFKFEEEEAPLFLKEQYPELFLSSEAPERLKDYFYKGLNFSLLSTYAKDWLSFLKGKDVLSSLIRGGDYPTESLIEYFHNFGDEKALELGAKKSETVNQMLAARQVLLMKTWYDKTGQTFIPDYVVMQAFPENQIDKFLASRLKWANFMRIKEFAKSSESRDAMLKLAYTFGVFDNDQSGMKRCYDLLTKLPTKINYDMGYILDRLDNILNGKVYADDFFRRGEVVSLYKAMIDENLDFPKDAVFRSLYRKSEDGAYILTIDQQKYPKSTAIFRETLGKFRELPILNGDLAHQLFGGFALIYNKDFYKFLLNNLDTIVKDTENSKYLAGVERQFAEIEIVNSNRHLTWDLAVKFVKENNYQEVELGNEEMATVAALAGYSQKDFNILQEIYDYGKQRTVSSIPRISGDTKEYHYEILRLDDPLALVIGTLTDCCQEINNVAEVCMAHSMTSQDGRVFVIKDPVGNIVAQSWVWRNGNVLCFDNIEIPDKAFERADLPRENFANEVYAIYKQAAQELIEQDKEIYNKLLSSGQITKQEYDDLVLAKVSVGLGYNDIAESLKTNASLDKGNIARPRPYEAPVSLNRGLYTNDSTTQYILKGSETHEPLNLYATLPVHHDEFIIYDDSNFTKKDLYHLQRLELLTKKDKSSLLTQIDSEEETNLVTSLAFSYNLNPKTTRVIYNTNIALIYDYDDTTIHLGDILYNRNIGLNRDKDITDVICLQVYFALKQIKGNKDIDVSKLNKTQLDIYNASKDVKEMETHHGR